MVSVGWMDHSKTNLGRGVLCKNVYFLRYCFLTLFFELKFIAHPDGFFYEFYAVKISKLQDNFNNVNAEQKKNLFF